MVGLVVLGVLAVLAVAGLVALYVWTRRSERDIEIPTRELSDEEKQTGIVRAAAIGNLISNGGGGAGR